jgi:hypothetical protein
MCSNSTYPISIYLFRFQFQHDTLTAVSHLFCVHSLRSASDMKALLVLKETGNPISGKLRL